MASSFHLKDQVKSRPGLILSEFAICAVKLNHGVLVSLNLFSNWVKSNQRLIAAKLNHGVLVSLNLISLEVKSNSR